MVNKSLKSVNESNFMDFLNSKEGRKLQNQVKNTGFIGQKSGMNGSGSTLSSAYGGTMQGKRSADNLVMSQDASQILGQLGSMLPTFTQGFNAQTLGGVSPNLLNVPSDQERLLINYLITKNFPAFFAAGQNYKAGKTRNIFWTKYAHEAIPIKTIIFRVTQDVTTTIIVGMLLGSEYYDACMLHKAVELGKERLAIAVICFFKNIKKRVPSKAFPALYNQELLKFVSDWKNSKSGVVSAILKGRRSKSEKIDDVKIMKDCLSLFQNIEKREEDLVMEVLLRYSKERICKISQAYYIHFGITVCEHLEKVRFDPCIVIYARHLSKCYGIKKLTSSLCNECSLLRCLVTKCIY